LTITLKIAAIRVSRQFLFRFLALTVSLRLVRLAPVPTARHKPKMTLTVRFAPSPTGYIHLGNARTALLNWLFAEKAAGKFILRFDDTDVARSKPEYAEAIGRDLAWLGIIPHQTLRQSDRFERYAAAAETLKVMGLLYPAYETSDELDRRRKRQMARGLPPVYDRAALKLTEDDRAKLEAEGRKPHWRFRLEARAVTWNDLIRGECHVDCASLSDPVLVREDGTYLYTLPSVVDDIELGISHVIRGEDHVTNTAVQIQIIEALGGAVPVFAHHNLLTTIGGEGLSKRMGHLSLGALRDAGHEALAVAALAVLTGSSDAVRPVASLDELRDLLDLGHISRGPAKFDQAELGQLTARTLHHLPYETVRERLAGLGIVADAVFWEAVQGNLETLQDAVLWRNVIDGAMTPVIGEPEFIATAARLLPPAPWSQETWKIWTDAIKTATGAKGRALFMPLRLAITGLDHGPELARLLPLIGPEKVLRRLAA
jgi:glutamyl-tRNA synthetase